MKVAVCMDDSHASQKALDEAIEFLNRNSGGELVLVHGVEEKTKNHNGNLVMEDIEKASERAESLLDRYKDYSDDNLKNNTNISTDLIKCENVSEKISEKVNDGDTEHLFIGHRGLEKQKNNVVSSFAKNIITRVEVPVTVVNNGN